MDIYIMLKFCEVKQSGSDISLKVGLKQIYVNLKFTYTVNIQM